MKRKAICLVMTVLFHVVSLSEAYAGFVDDWLAQKTVTTPSFYEGSQRGYITAGGFEARLPAQNSVYPITVSLPRLKTGCGGIDAYAGGLGFMNFNMLVQKLQGVLQAAPLVAFDIALNTLCTTCSNVMKGAESIANALNGLQLNSCSASKAAVAYVMDQSFGGDVSPDKEQKLHSMYADYAQNSGMTNLWTSFTNTVSAAGGQQSGTGIAPSAMISGCPQDIQDLFGTSGFLLNNIAHKVGFSATWASYMRALSGDLYIFINDTDFFVSYVAPCSGAKSANAIVDFMDGTGWQKTGTDDSSCAQVSDTNSSMKAYVYNILQNVMTEMSNKQQPQANELTFLQGVPMSIHSMIKTGVLTNQQQFVATNAAEPIAKQLTNTMLTDLYGVLRSALLTAHAIADAQQGAAGNNAQYTCQLQMYSDDIAKIPSMVKEVELLLRELHDQYAQTMAETDNLEKITKKIADLDVQSRQMVIRAFGPSMKRQK